MVYDQNNIETAIKRQQTATYGDLRSPIRAAFQNVPNALKFRSEKRNRNQIKREKIINKIDFQGIFNY